MLPYPVIVRLTGTSYYQRIIRMLEKGDKLKITHEPDNGYDENAIKVENDNKETVGYIPKNVNQRLLADSSAFLGEVEEILQGDTWGIKIRVQEPVKPEEPHQANTPSVLVHYRNGREVGTLLKENEDGSVLVHTANGNIQLPARIITIGERKQNHESTTI